MRGPAVQQSVHSIDPGYETHPANTTRWNNDVLMLGQRRRRWANIKTSLFKRVVFAGETHPATREAGITPGQCLTRWPNIKTTVQPDISGWTDAVLILD